MFAGLQGVLAAALGQHFAAGIGTWLLVPGAMLLSIVAAVAAGWLPARAVGKQTPIQALQGGHRETLRRPKFPFAVVVMIVFGLAAGTLALVSAHRESDRMGFNPLAGSQYIGAGLMFAITVLGCVLSVPWLLGRVGLMARWMPLWLRMAARDTARSRRRTVPAIAAIVAATVIGVPLLMGVKGFDMAREADWLPPAPTNYIEISPQGSVGPDVMAQAQNEIAADTTVVGGHILQAHEAIGSLDCSTPGTCVSSFRTVTADPQLISDLSVDVSPAQVEQQLNAGGAVLFNGMGNQTLDVMKDYNSDSTQLMSVPVMWATPREESVITKYYAYVSEQTGKSLSDFSANDDNPGWTAQLLEVQHPLTPQQLTAIEDQYNGQLFIGGWEPYQSLLPSLYSIALVVMLGVALLATVTAVALNAALQERDLSILRRLGGSPIGGRMIAGLQGAIIGAVAAVPGVAVGIAIGAAVMKLMMAVSVVLPVGPILITLLGVPAIAFLAGLASAGTGRRNQRSTGLA